MTNTQTRGEPLASAVVSEDHTRQVAARGTNRRVKYHFNAAPLDKDGPGGLPGDGIVTASASNLNGLPYAITVSGDSARVLHATARGKTYAVLGKPFDTVEVAVPDDVDAVEIFICNDAYEARRKTPLFKVTPNPSGMTHVYVHELPQVRLRRLQANAATATAYPATTQGQTAKKPDDTHIGYLTGDVWKALSFEFSLTDVSRLCTGSTLERPYAEDRGRGVITPEAGPPTAPPTVLGLPRPDGAGPELGAARQPPAPVRQGTVETLAIADWAEVLAPIYEGRIAGRVGTRYSDFGCHIDLPVVNIRLKYQQGAFSNAIGAADSVEIADVLKRTNPVTYKGIVEAAWKTGIDELILSSTWRPMLGSILHRKGVGVDVVFVDDLDDRDAQGRPINRFKIHVDSGRPSALYSSFEAIVLNDPVNLGGFHADPWNRGAKDTTHSNHLHVSAEDSDAI